MDSVDLLGIISWVILFIISLAGIFFFLYCGYIYYVHRKYDHISGPPRDRAQTYGPVVRINILHNVKILLSSPEGLKEILMSSKYKKDKEYNRAFQLFGERFMGNGLVTVQDNDQWEQQRRKMDPAFSKNCLVGFIGPLNEKAEELVNRLTEKADGKHNIEMYDAVSRVTLEALNKAAFGLELNCLTDEHCEFLRAISLAMNGLMESMDHLTKYNPWKKDFICEIRKSVRLLRDTARECIKRRQKAQQDQEQMPEDVLTHMLLPADLESDCDLESLVDNFVSIIIGGQVTTASVLTFALMELARNPEIMKKVWDEVDGVVGSKTDIEYEDLEKLQYLSQVLKETLRLYPAAPGTSRSLEEEKLINGVRIPAHVTVMLNSYIMGRMEQFFQDPFIFNPDRFHPDAAEPYFSYFPFSLGPRACIGKEFAEIMMKVILAKLVHKFNFHLIEGQVCKVTGTGTLQPSDGLICRLNLRTRQRRSLTRRTL